MASKNLIFFGIAILMIFGILIEFNVFYGCNINDPNYPSALLANNNIVYCGDDNGCIGGISKGYNTDYGNRYELYSTIAWNYVNEMENLSTVNFTKLTDVINWQTATSMVKVGNNYYIAYEDYSNNNHNPKIKFMYLSNASAPHNNISFEISQQGMRYYYAAMTYESNKIYLAYMGRGESDLQASLYYRECTPSAASLSCTNEEKIAAILVGDAKEPAIARYNGRTYIAYVNNSDIYIYTKEDNTIIRPITFAEKIAFNWNYSINGDLQELISYLASLGIIANDAPNTTQTEIKFANATLTLINKLDNTYYVLIVSNKGKYALKVKKEDIIKGNITVYGADTLCEVDTKGQKMNMTCEAHHPNIIFKDGNLYVSYQVDTPLLDTIDLHYPIKDKITGTIKTIYFVRATLTDNRIYIDKCVQANCTAATRTILHKAVSAEGVKKSDFDDASFNTATFSSIKNPWLFEFNNSVYVSVDASDAPYVWKYNESAAGINVVNLDSANITKTINMDLVKYGGAYTKCAFSSNEYISAPDINERDVRGYPSNDPVININLTNVNTSELKVKVGGDEITLTIDGNNMTTVAPDGMLSENATLNSNMIILKLNRYYYIKTIDDLETIGEWDFIDGKYIYNVTVIVGNGTEQDIILKIGNISIGDFVAPNIRDEDVKIVNLKDKGELHAEDTVYINVSLKSGESLPAVVKVFFQPYVNNSENIIYGAAAGLQLGDPNLDLIFDNQGIENGFGLVGVEGKSYVLPDKVNNQTTYYLKVTVVVYDMCCNFQVWNEVLNITKKEGGALCPECEPQVIHCDDLNGDGMMDVFDAVEALEVLSGEKSTNNNVSNMECLRNNGNLTLQDVLDLMGRLNQ
ncbi:MAG: hypothetical protein CVT88_01965 [Candidatus Altiarchaeales archaeon HGW-Altiarchaeales-1]|nr:MAG: hypothetical protein CVT88_01965 [Candidatus Altiarchaeales archaeon HGW-Altiarchaeales-1]